MWVRALHREGSDRCAECGRTVEVPFSKVADRGQRFCSRACANRFNGRVAKDKAAQAAPLRPLCACGCGQRIGKQATKYRSGHNPTVPPPPRRGPANHRWNGGPKRPQLSLEHREWRERVFARDNWTCLMCGRRSRPGQYVVLNAHHIVPVSVDPQLAYVLSNGMTLCRECHADHHWGVDRKRRRPRKSA